MNREKQRTFVCLRQTEGGRESGYARAEMRENGVKLSVVVQGFSAEDAAYAFAVTEERLRLIGRLNLDGRGQGGLVAQIGAQEYGQIRILFVGRAESNAVSIPLAGTIGRGGWVDWTQMRALAAETLGIAGKDEEPEQAPAEEEESVMPEPEPVQEDTEEPDLCDLPAQEEDFAAAERALRTEMPKERCTEMPHILRNAYWPQKLWPIHDLFGRFEEEKQFGDQENTAYIRVPLGGAAGEIGHYLIGAQVRDGWVTGIGYLIPGKEQARPAGLTGYTWQDGYWQSWQYADND